MTVLLEEIEGEAVEETRRKLGGQLELTKAELAAAKRDLTKTRKELQTAREIIEALQHIDAKHQKPAPWKLPRKKSTGHEGVVSLVLSDLHLDEKVFPEEVEGLNAYDREIAHLRLKRCVERTIMLSREYISGVDIAGLNLFAGGDWWSGLIHEELRETNEAPLPASIVWWLDPLSAAIGELAEAFGRVHVAGVVGNHPRNTRKPRMKGRVIDNWDWAIYKLLERDFRNDDRVTFQIPQSADTTVQIYDTKFLFTHGDQFRGGSGIAGLLSPMMTGEHRKAKRAMKIDKTFDYLVMGHWHQLSYFRNIIVNGSTKGYDEYAYMGNFDFEPPQQAFWVTTPEHGVTFQAPVLVQDRKKEGW